MTEIKQTQIEALKAKIFSVITVHNELLIYNEGCNTDELANVLVTEWIDENNILITD